MSQKRYKLPEKLDKPDGERRSVGVEVEMSGIDLAMITCQINVAYGGRIKEVSPYEFVVGDTDIGDIKVELDFEYLKRIGREKASRELDKNEFSEFEHYASDALALLSKNFVPCELVGPPLAVDRLHELDIIVDRLRDHGAKGSGYSFFYAFGVHLNPELPDLETETIINYFKAFVCLQDWLVKHEEVSLNRKLLPFIDKFPRDYIRKVVTPEYRPSLEQFIDDYLEHNPSRNRSLDMMPVFAYLDESRLKRQLEDDEKINKRPTFHYRLPNSDIDNPEWGLWKSWNNWLQVEALANDPDRLQQVCEAYLKSNEILSGNFMKPWKDQVNQWLIDL